MSAALSSLKCFARETKYLCTEIHLHDHLTKRILQQCLLYFISLRHNLYPCNLTCERIYHGTYKTMIMKVFWKRWFTITCAGTILFYRVNQSTILTLTWRWWETSREPSSWSSDSSGVSGTWSINGCTIYTTSSAGRGRGPALPQVCPVCSSTRTRSMTTL